jgi:hypothetical protein
VHKKVLEVQNLTMKRKSIIYFVLAFIVMIATISFTGALANRLLEFSADMHGFIYNQGLFFKYCNIVFFTGMFIASVLFYFGVKFFLLPMARNNGKRIRIFLLFMLLIKTTIVFTFISVALQLISKNEVSIPTEQIGALIAILICIVLDHFGKKNSVEL